MISRILVGIDDSDGADAALRWTVEMVDEAATRREPPDIAAVAAWSAPPFDLAGLADGKLLEQAAVDGLERSLTAVPRTERFERVVRSGAAAEVIVDTARQLDADLVVVGRRGRGGLAPLLLGSVSRSVASRADRPVAIVPATATWSPGPTVVGYDGSPGGEAALRWAATNSTGRLIVVSAWHLPTDAIYDPAGVDIEAFEVAVTERVEQAIDRLTAEWPDPGLSDRIETVVERDDPRLVLVERAKGASWVVLGARARRGLRGLLLGSTVDYVASHAEQAVVVVPPIDRSDHDADRTEVAGDRG